MIVPTEFFQIAWVVPDLDSAIRRFQKNLNTGPFFLNAHVQVENPLYRGKPAPPSDYSLALAQSGRFQIELIEQHDDTPSVYRDLYPAGVEGFHHMGAFVPDVEAEIRRYEKMGAAVASDCMFGDMRVAYIDARPLFGFMVEIMDHTPVVDGLFQHIADAADDWDGSDPIRPIPALEII